MKFVGVNVMSCMVLHMLLMHDGESIVKKKIIFFLQVFLHVKNCELMTTYLNDHSYQIHNLVAITFS
jgi:hypothetical protein